MRIRPLALVAAGLLLAAVSACSSSLPSTPPRTEPDQVEKSAVLAAQFHSLETGAEIPDDAWVQIWTPNQAATRIARCVDRGSDGLMIFRAEPFAATGGGLSYSVITVPKSTSVDGGVGPPYFDSSTAQRLVDGCVAEFPIDFRLFSVPERDRAALYAYDLTVLRRCLISHGQPVARLPDRTRFESLMRANAPWDAYDHVVVSDRRAWYALADACPAFPLAIAGDVAASTTSATTP